MFFRIVLMVCCLFSFGSRADDSLPGKVSQFVDLFDYTQASYVYDIRILQADYPTKLLTPETMLPQTAEYPLKDMRRLFRLAKNCSGKLPLSPLVTEPLIFVRAICRGTPLPEKWFSRSGMIHPGGGSYAARYVNVYPETFDTLKSYMHIKERPLAAPDQLLGRLQRMSYPALSSLISGAEMFMEDEVLWLRKGDKYYLFPPEVWSANRAEVGLNFRIVSDNSYCPFRRGNVCWETEDNSDLLINSMIALVILNLVLVTGWLIYRWNVKRQELKNRMLVLQILTHELRTPIASLSLTVEGFRREFEQLPESVYGEFTRLCQDTRRLRQLAEASKDYLQSDSQAMGTDWLPSVVDWLTARYEESEIDVEIIADEDAAIKVSVYWLGTCLDNLVSNAAKYGVSPIKIKFRLRKNGVIFSVLDQGCLTRKDWKKLRKPFVSKAGLGLGLTIVESMVGKMGGTMTLEGPPTTFIMEIPCETDIATC